MRCCWTLRTDVVGHALYSSLNRFYNLFYRLPMAPNHKNKHHDPWLT